MTLSEDSTIKKSAPAFSQLFATALLLISIVQGVLFTVALSQLSYKLGAVSISIALFLTFRKFLSDRKRTVFRIGLLLFFLHAVMFSIYYYNQWSLESVDAIGNALLILYLALFVASLVSVSMLFSSPNIYLLTFSIAFCLIALEITLPWIFSSEVHSLTVQKKLQSVKWEAVFKKHPVIGMYNGPNQVMKTYYPGNPREYFKKEDPRGQRWQLLARHGSEANLIFPPDDKDALRVEIDNAAEDVKWHIELDQKNLSLESDKRYRLMFSIRSDQPRDVSVDISQAHAPWENLGLYKTFKVGPERENVSFDFEVKQNDDNARISFDLGGSAVSVDISSVELKSVEEGNLIIPSNLSEPRYVVDYRINSMGCRGPEYPASRAENSFRVLLLGDSYTFGVGVHEEDTFTAQLEAGLNSNNPERKNEVINCGVSGYATLEERRFYEFFGSKYKPDVVLLVMVNNDDISWEEEVKNKHYYRPSKLDNKFNAIGLIRKRIRNKPEQDFTGSLKEIWALDKAVTAQGARLGVVVFENICTENNLDENRAGIESWNKLIKTVDDGLRGTEIPLLTIGKSLCKENYSDKDLWVYEGVDYHPNEIAHKIAAKKMKQFLVSNGMME